jgi:hypothetical protein
VQAKIDENIRASTSQEVGTVILLDWRKKALGGTLAGTKYQLNCEVIVVDEALRRIVSRKQLVGGEPAFATLFGDSPQDKIVEYINSLHRQEASPRAATDRSNSVDLQIERSDMCTYSDMVNNLSFSYPTAWAEMSSIEATQVMGASAAKYLTVFLYNPKDRNQNLNVQVLSTTAQDLSEIAFTEFAKEMDRQLPDAFSGFRKMSSRVGRLRDMALLEYVFEGTRPDGVRICQKQLRTGKPGKEVVVTFTAPAEAYDKANEMCFRVIVNSLTVN